MKNGHARAISLIVMATCLQAPSVFSWQQGSPTVSPGQDEDIEFQAVERLLRADEASPQTEMQEIFARVEISLHHIDMLLADASAGETDALAKVAKSGIQEIFDNAERRPSGANPGAGDPSSEGSSGSSASPSVGEVLRVSHGRGQQVLAGIDRILEIAANNGGT